MIFRCIPYFPQIKAVVIRILLCGPTFFFPLSVAAEAILKVGGGHVEGRRLDNRCAEGSKLGCVKGVPSFLLRISPPLHFHFNH